MTVAFHLVTSPAWAATSEAAGKKLSLVSRGSELMGRTRVTLRELDSWNQTAARQRTM